MRPFEKEVAATQRWFDTARFAGTVRLYRGASGSRAARHYRL